ncbi:hypothetical protein K6X13_14785 [Xanthomonas euvesicatoria pv. allii]|uniref:hypothetical protein n=1 Tax=Xanthomonas euvesicatoria TaxID=456327 RepID=UPI002405C4D3|nr:hypothetical protein [Xanthomonas euvesicatoria]MCP3048346.1 hypothetical protein [Xanthomonas euvesicatoria pv. allii]
MKLNGEWAMYGLAVLVAAGVLLAFKGADLLKIREAKIAAADTLMDPDSAKFRNVHLQGVIVCGEVNGKNGYGAYAGYKRFYYLEPIAVVDPGTSPDEVKQILWRSYKKSCPNA